MGRNHLGEIAPFLVLGAEIVIHYNLARILVTTCVYAGNYRFLCLANIPLFPGAIQMSPYGIQRLPCDPKLASNV